MTTATPAAVVTTATTAITTIRVDPNLHLVCVLSDVCVLTCIRHGHQNRDGWLHLLAESKFLLGRH